MDLRVEIVEAQKARLDLLKWKVILVAALGAAASGIVETHRASNPNLLFALVPLVCIYVDLLSRDQTLRIIVMSRYLLLDKLPTETAYEDFVDQVTRMQVATVRESLRDATVRFRKALNGTSTASAYAFQAFAQDWSTVFLSGAVIVWAIASGVHGLDEWATIASGTIGLVLALTFYLAYARRYGTIQELALKPWRDSLHPQTDVRE
jgi:hypothetical protein